MCMKYIKLILICTMLITLICGCSDTNTRSVEYTPVKLDTADIIKYEDLWQISYVRDTNDEVDEYNIIEPELFDNMQLSELIIVGDDNSVDYQIVDESDIIYNNQRYIGLYTAILNCELPYNENTFINFIIKTYNTGSNIIYVSYSNSNDIVDDECTDSNITDFLVEYDDYHRLYNEKGKYINWMLTLTSEDGKIGKLFGCDKYLAYYNDKNKIIDMSLYDTSTNNSEGITSEENLTEEVTTETSTETETNDIETPEKEETTSEEDITEYVEN